MEHEGLRKLSFSNDASVDKAIRKRKYYHKTHF